MADKLKITINGKEFETDSGSTVLQVALENGIHIPHFCYHPHLKNAGNCRMCLVEVEKSPKLLTACSTPVMDEMVVHTESDIVLSAREGIMEFLLINHPLDCPVCDQAGECDLQNYSQLHGSGRSRFIEDKNRSKKHRVLGPDIIIDNERCIKCQRCVRFLRDIAGTGELGYFKRGDHANIDIFEGHEIDNDYSINITDLCPVGALTDRNFRFKKRVWYLRKKPSVCNMCARGCNINFWVNDDFTNETKVWRITPRDNNDVNRCFMCNQGRLQYKDFESAERLISPQIKKNGTLSDADINDVIDASVIKLVETAEKYGKDSVVFVTSPYASNEELFLMKVITDKMFDEKSIQVAEGEKWKGDDLLKVEDKSPNSVGVKEIFGKTSKPDLKKAKAVVIFKTDNVDEKELGEAEFTLVLEPESCPAALNADAVIPVKTWYEDDGTFTNCDGRVQKFMPALIADEGVTSGWKALSMLGKALGVEGIELQSPSKVFDILSGEVKNFKDMNYSQLGFKGKVTGGKK